MAAWRASKRVCYLIGVSSTIHKALVVRDPKGSPNTPEMQKHADSQHVDLLGFAQWWIEQGKGRY